MAIRIRNLDPTNIKVNNTNVRFVKIRTDDRAIWARHLMLSIISNETVSSYETVCTSTSTYEINNGDKVRTDNIIYDGCTYEIKVNYKQAYQKTDNPTFTVNDDNVNITLPIPAKKVIQPITLQSYDIQNNAYSIVLYNPNDFNVSISDNSSTNTILAKSTITISSSNISIEENTYFYTNTFTVSAILTDDSSLDNITTTITTTKEQIERPSSWVDLHDKYKVYYTRSTDVKYNKEYYQNIAYNKSIELIGGNLSRVSYTIGVSKYTYSSLKVNIRNYTKFNAKYVIDGNIIYGPFSSKLSKLVSSESKRSITIEPNKEATKSILIDNILSDKSYKFGIDSLELTLYIGDKKVTTFYSNPITCELLGNYNLANSVNVYQYNAGGTCFRGECTVHTPSISKDLYNVISKVTTSDGSARCCANTSEVCEYVASCPQDMEITLKSELEKTAGITQVRFK